MLLAAHQQAVRLSSSSAPGPPLCVHTAPCLQAAARCRTRSQTACCVLPGPWPDQQHRWRHQHLQAGHCRQHALVKQRPTCAAAGSAAPVPPSSSSPGDAGLGAKAGSLVVLGVLLASGTANRVLYRMALVPLKDYIFFLAQCQNLLYILVYFTLLALRYRQGKVTDAMLSLPKAPFVLTGACEAAAQVLLMVSAANLPGALLPLVAQTSLVWNLGFSCLIFKLRPTFAQVGGVALVIAGVVLASLPSEAAAAGSSSMAVAAATLPSISPLYVGLSVLSYAFPAAATVLKERLFKTAAQQLGGRQLDVLVVNSFCSAAQGFWVLLLLPIMASIRGISLDRLPGYLSEGAAHLIGTASPAGVTAATPLVALIPFAYLVVNIVFNISAMYMVRSAGAVATGLWMTLLIPVQLVAFGQPLPLLHPVQLGPAFGAGTALLLAGLMLYNREAWASAARGLLQRKAPDTA